MPIDFGSIKITEFEKHLKNIMDKVSDLSEEEKEALLVRLGSEEDKQTEEEPWSTHLDSANKCYLDGYRGSDENIVLPDTINGMSYEVAPRAFRRSDIESVTISPGVTSIGRMAFQDCDKLHTVIFSEGFFGLIQDSAFMSCDNIKEFAFPIGIEILSCAVITRCHHLETVYIPDSVKEICAYALAENINLKDICFNGTISQWKLIKKARFWDNGIGDYTIYCTDGQIKSKK